MAVPDLSDHITIVRGGGDIGSGVIWRLRRVGFPVIVTELERPLTIRRTVAFPAEAIEVAATGAVPVLVSPDIPDIDRSVVVDARLAKRNLGTSRDHAPFVVALGPGFTAGDDCDAIVETMRGHDLGRVIWDGAAIPNTGVPGMIGGGSVPSATGASDGRSGSVMSSPRESLSARSTTCLSEPGSREPCEACLLADPCSKV